MSNTATETLSVVVEREILFPPEKIWRALTHTRTLARFINEAISHKVSLISTDDHRGYRGLDASFPHGMVHHGAGEYVYGAIHTNTIEGFWSLVKRGIMGSFHRVSHAYLPLYVNEFEFRYNHRKNPDIFGAAIRACCELPSGYRAPTAAKDNRAVGGDL